MNSQDFECIPLQTLHSETCTELSDDDIFYSDEFGNYVFPIFQQPPGTCSCPHRYKLTYINLGMVGGLRRHILSFIV